MAYVIGVIGVIGVHPRTGVLADRLEQPPTVRHRGDGHHEALVDEPAECCANVGRPDPAVRRDGRCRVDRETCREHRHPAQDRLLGRGEQAEAPLEGVVHRPVPVADSRAADEQCLVVAQTALDSFQSQSGYSHGCQLDRESQPVEGPADLADPRQLGAVGGLPSG
jgi:hypothetical protein